jgi:hypothetical protein
LLFFLVISFPAFLNAQTSSNERGDFFIAPTANVIMYGVDGVSYGAGLTAGYGTGTAIGLQFVWFFSSEDKHTIELCFFLRFYLLGVNAYSGPYLQLLAGSALFNRPDDFSIPAFSGTISAGLNFGWRFVFGERWFVEPSVRGGYPYMFGGGVSAGIRL